MMGNMWASSHKNLVCLTGETLGETINETKRIEAYRNCGFLCLTQCLTFPFNVSPATGEGL